MLTCVYACTHIFLHKISMIPVIYLLLCFLHLPIVLVVGSELQIRLEKTRREIVWDSLGMLLPGNAEMTPRCSDTLGENYLHLRYLTTASYNCITEHVENQLKNFCN